MGDSYHPSYGPPGGRRPDRDPRRRQNDRHDRYSPPPPPPPARDYRDDRRDGRRDGGFAFRGAAGGQADNYRPPQRSDFSFRAPGNSTAPSFPNEPPPRRTHPLPSRPRPDKKQGARRGGHHGPPRRFGPKPAHERAILKYTEKETTPEQLVGMNGNTQPKYFEVISSDEEDDADANGALCKRAKTESTVPAVELPKWSNPDPYSALPPTDMGIGPKKDIVQTIRKAKNDALARGSGSNAVKDNVDFISFDADEDMSDEDDDDEDDDSSEGDDDDLVGAPPAPVRGLTMPSDQELMDSYIGSNTANGKRKRGAEPVHSAGDIIDEWASNGSDPTPWVPDNSDYHSNVGLQLHREIIDFYDFVQPRFFEEDCRRDLVDRIQQSLMGLREARHVQLKTFGSFASGMYLPTADMDLVAVSADYMDTGRKSFCQHRAHMQKLGRHLDSCGIVKRGTLAVVAKAKVPIIKFVDARTGIKVDISFENDTGLTAVPTLCGWKKQYPHMPVLVALIKQFLAMRGLNEVFSGGIGGFTIICLVTSMLQLKPEMQSNSADIGYGDLLMDFFDLYGNKFDLTATGIYMNPPGYFRKGIDRTYAKLNMNGLSIIDPNRADNDISGGSRLVSTVFKHFRGAFSQIQRRLSQIRNGDDDNTSILGCIIGGNYTSFEKQRNLLYRLGGSSGDHGGRRGYDGQNDSASWSRAPRYEAPPEQYYNRYSNQQEQHPSVGPSQYSNQHQPVPFGYAPPQAHPPPPQMATPKGAQDASKPPRQKKSKAAKKAAKQLAAASATDGAGMSRKQRKAANRAANEVARQAAKKKKKQEKRMNQTKKPQVTPAQNSEQNQQSRQEVTPAQKSEQNKQSRRERAQRRDAQRDSGAFDHLFAVDDD